MNSPIKAFQASNAQSVKMDGMPGGTLRVSPNESFAVLRGLPCRPFYFGMAKYAMDSRARDILYGLLKRDAKKLFTDRRWAIKRPHALENACELAIDMHIFPQVSYCRTCLGSGHSSMGVICRRCGGNGVKSLTNVAIAERLGVDESSVRANWSRHLDELYRTVAGWEREIYAHLRRENEGA